MLVPTIYRKIFKVIGRWSKTRTNMFLKNKTIISTFYSLHKAPNSLLEDRIKFKLFAAKFHLENLQKIKEQDGTVMGKHRLYSEIEIDGFFAEIIGAKDSLLILINEKFQIGCSNRSPRLLDDINKKDTNTANILTDLTNLVNDKNDWFYLLNELRNHSIHRNMLNKKAAVHVGSNDSEEFFLNPLTKQPMDISIIKYLEKSLQNMTNLIKTIRDKDTLLK